MILYHGSNASIRDIDLEKCRPYKDFGQGFYLTSIDEQAAQMARRTTRLYGGSPFVSTFRFDETALADNNIRSLTFEKPDKDWALFVLNNRDRKYNDTKNALCNQDNKYDIVTGPVANDDIAYLLRTFSSGLIDMEALIKGLEYKFLSTQFSFHTERALKYLQPMEGNNG
jgi:hypothetical protein